MVRAMMGKVMKVGLRECEVGLICLLHIARR